MITRQHKIQQEKEATPMKNNRWWGIVAATLLYLVTSTAQSSTYYFHTDHLGTPQVLTDENQSVVWKGEYDPFGEATETVDTVEQNLRFPGQYLDRESGLHYNYFRTYDPIVGRYTQSDPIGLDGGYNTYSYVKGNPINRYDMYGLSENVTLIRVTPFPIIPPGSPPHTSLSNIINSNEWPDIFDWPDDFPHPDDPPEETIEWCEANPPPDIPDNNDPPSCGAIAAAFTNRCIAKGGAASACAVKGFLLYLACIQ